MANPFRSAGDYLLGRYRALTIGGKIALLYVLAALLPLLVTNLYANNTLNSSAHSSQMTAAERGFEQTLGVLNDRFYRVLRMCDVIALDPALNERLYAHDPSERTLWAQWSDMNAILTTLSQRRDDLDIFGISLYVRDEWIYSKRTGMISGLDEARERPWYNVLTATNRHAMFFPPGAAGEEGVLSCLRRVRNLDDLGDVQAFLRIDVPVDEIERVLRQGSVAEGSISVLITEGGVVVAASEAIEPTEAELGGLIALAGAPKGFHELDDNHLAQCAPVEGSDWYLATLLSRGALARANAYAWLGVALLLLIAALPTVVLARRILRGMTDRIHRLGDHMLSVRLGDLNPTERDANRDEIGVMTDSYNYMIERMRSLMGEQYRIGQEARSSELLALQSQINPHFLYNTLDLLRWMARKGQTDEIQTVVKALADFYRASLSRGRDVVTLRDELHLIESYMTIQNMRFGDGVTLSVEAEEAALDCVLPKITLQPIVENALLHGILPKEDKCGVITIACRVTGGSVMIDIADDGVGMSEERVATMLYPARESGEGGYGLFNIEKRMCLTFGIHRCIGVVSHPGEGMRVRLVFPARLGEGD